MVIYGRISEILDVPKSTITTSYKSVDKYKLAGMSNVKSEVTITKDLFTIFDSEMTLMYEIPWPSLYTCDLG
jgi:hypothetical protein